MGCVESDMHTQPVCNDQAFANHEFGRKVGESFGQVRLVSQKVFLAKYELGEKIGEGAFGQVRLVRERFRTDDSSLAVKVISLRASSMREVFAEDRMWRLVGDHPNIVNLRETFMDAGPAKIACFVMEGCMSSLLGDESLMLRDEKVFPTLATDMLTAIKHVHSFRVIHRDVKPDNFLISNSEVLTVKLCDFGLADMLPARGFLEGMAGTDSFMAPEIIGGDPYDYAVDVWSFGVTCYLILFGELPYSPVGERTSAAFRTAVLKGKEPSFLRSDPTFDTPSQAATHFVKSLLTRSAKSRPSAAEALKLDFIQNARVPIFRTEVLQESENLPANQGGRYDFSGCDAPSSGIDSLAKPNVAASIASTGTPESSSCGSTIDWKTSWEDRTLGSFFSL